MKFFLALLAVAFCHEILVTQEYTDYLKRTVDWEVVDYEDNIFRGWTVDEVKSLLGYNGFEEFEGEPISEGVTPSSIDWSGANCDHGVKDQGRCGSCWAFAIVGMMSYRCCAVKGDHGWLSPQELVSCDKGNHGCQGGYLESPMRYIKNAGGLVKESCFPYKAANLACPGKCADGKDWKSAHVCHCTAYKTCGGGDAGMKACLAIGPTTFGFQVERSFQSYKSGIYKCTGSGRLGGHAVLAMGRKDNPCHYHVKNSWGTGWGMRGYFDIACGTCQMQGGVVCTQF